MVTLNNATHSHVPQLCSSALRRYFSSGLFYIVMRRPYFTVRVKYCICHINSGVGSSVVWLRKIHVSAALHKLVNSNLAGFLLASCAYCHSLADHPAGVGLETRKLLLDRKCQTYCPCDVLEQPSACSDYILNVSHFQISFLFYPPSFWFWLWFKKCPSSSSLISN